MNANIGIRKKHCNYIMSFGLDIGNDIGNETLNLLRMYIIYLIL